MKLIPDKSIDMILCDLPYGTTECKWDTVIPFTSLWEQYERIIKSGGAVVLTGQNPFSAKLICSKIEWFKHSLVWEKNKCANFLLGNYQPLKMHEDILVFSEGGFAGNATIKCTYNPQMVQRWKVKKFDTRILDRTKAMNEICSRPNPTKLVSSLENFKEDKNLPQTIVFFPVEQSGKLHPTQKPVTLFEYLIKTYTNEGDTVLDNCAGSGTTAIACMNTGRNYILMEKEQKYYDIILKRIKEHTPQLKIAI